MSVKKIQLALCHFTATARMYTRQGTDHVESIKLKACHITLPAWCTEADLKAASSF